MTPEIHDLTLEINRLADMLPDNPTMIRIVQKCHRVFCAFTVTDSKRIHALNAIHALLARDGELSESEQLLLKQLQETHGWLELEQYCLGQNLYLSFVVLEKYMRSLIPESEDR